jgi:SPP1 family predicted phage head-tail adaptor
MRIGDMRKRVVIQRATVAADDFGQDIPTWSNLATVWAQVRPLSGRELVNARQVKDTVSHKITTRQSVTITPADRLVLGTRVFNIESVIKTDELNQWLEILATELIGETP